MSIIIDTSNLTYEIDEDGDLLFPDYDLAYDQAAMEFGYPKSNAVEMLDMWNADATTTFLGLLFDDLSLNMAILITKAWLDMVVERFGIEQLDGFDVRQLIDEIDDAISQDNEPTFFRLEAKLGSMASGYQQQAWLHGGAPFGPSQHFQDAQARFNLVLAITGYLYIAKYSMPIWVSFWSCKKKKSNVIHHITDIPNSCSFEIARREVPQHAVGDQIAPMEAAKRHVRKEFVGAAVRAIVKVEGA